MPDRLLSSTEAATWLGASPTSVKRWADAGLIECVRTAGNHRRFRVEALERFTQTGEGAEATESGPKAEAPAENTPAVWIDTLVRENTHAVRARLFAERARVGSWAEVSDRVGPVLTAMGVAWERGELDVVQEHVASERLARGLMHISEALPIAAHAPRAMLATATGDDHTLGLSLAELTLREAGWQTLWAGRRTPTEQLSAAMRAGSIGMLAISASSFSDDAAQLAEFVDVAHEACAEAGARLIVGGRGAWPKSDARFIQIGSFRELRTLALDWA